MEHPSARELENYNAGKLSAHGFDVIAKHLEQCPHCIAVIEQLPAGSLAQALQEAGNGDEISEDAFKTRSSASLLGRMQQGEKKAWKRFAAIYAALVQDWALAQGVDGGEAQRFAQQAFFLLIKRFRQAAVMPTPGFRNWLQRVIHDAWRDYWNPSSDQAYDNTARSNLFFEQRYRPKVVDHWMQAARMDFPENTWRAFKATALDSRSTGEVARELGSSPVSVWLACHQVVARLRHELEDLL